MRYLVQKGKEKYFGKKLEKDELKSYKIQRHIVQIGLAHNLGKGGNNCEHFEEFQNSKNSAVKNMKSKW